MPFVCLGQLIRVNDPHENATWVYNYDRGGNILSKVRYAYTTGALGTAVETIPYAYSDSNWKDKLTAYNGTAITYDAIGNPLNDGSWTYEWAVGRQLKKMSKPGKEIEFKYDFNGLRTQKIVTENGVTTTTNYLLHGKLVTHMTIGNDNLHFFYDNSSRPAKVDFNGMIYTYVHNLQGDIVGILDSTGNLVVEYKYDAWGKPLSTVGSLSDTLGMRNPFGYRSYFYDVETGLYYARSRYYVSEWSRFLNADSAKILEETVGQQFGGNLYQYCKNACPIAADEDGNWLNLVIGAIAGAVISAGCQIVSNVVQGKDAMDGVLTAAASGAITGAVAASGVGVIGQVIVGGAVGAGAEFAQQMIDTGGDVDPLNCFVDCVVAGGMGMLSAVIGGNGLLYYKDSVYQNGIRLLNVIRNVERGMYSSAGKAARRLAAVGAEYVSEYIKQATAATVKYTIGATVATALKAPAQNGLKNLIRHLGYRSTFACVSLQVM